MIWRALAIASVLASCAPPAGAQITGRASVIDGDTLDVQGQRIRLWGADAPETGQTCARSGDSYRGGQVAANQLERRIAGRPVVCVPQDVIQHVVSRDL